MRLADVVCSEGARNSSEAWSHFVGVDSLAEQASLPTIGREETKGGGSYDTIGQAASTPFSARPSPAASLSLSLCRSRCDHAMRPASSLRAFHLTPPEELPRSIIARAAEARYSKLKDTLNMASPIPVPLPRNSSSDPILVSAESSGREADRFNTSQ